MAESSTGGGKANVVLVQCDSMDGRVMGCMGHPAMERATPNMDALARRGVLFRNAYTNNPICCPARAVMWSGRHTHHCEGWNNYKGLEGSDPTFRTHLDDAGYLTQTFGKTDYLSGRHTIRARVSAWTRSAGIPRPHYRMRAPRILEDDTAHINETDWADVENSIAWLKDAAQGDRPFMLYLGIRAPHPPFLTSRRYLDLIDEAGVTIPPPDEEEHPAQRQMRIVKGWEHGHSDKMVRAVRRTYFGMVAEVDAMLGQVVAAMDEMGLADSTYLLFTGDHGEMAMEHRQAYKMTLFDSSARVPMIVAGPGVREGAEVEAPVSLVDVYPTLMDMAGLPHPAGLDGHSLMPDLAGHPGDRPDWVLAQCHDTGCVTGTYMLRRGSWKYIAYVGYGPQLFNLEDDPDEVRNLAALRPKAVKEMDGLLHEIVDVEAVDATVKAYDRQSFREWREEQRAAGTYEGFMARIHAGWDHLDDVDIAPWRAEDERAIEEWLAGGKA